MNGNKCNTGDVEVANKFEMIATEKYRNVSHSQMKRPHNPYFEFLLESNNCDQSYPANIEKKIPEKKLSRRTISVNDLFTSAAQQRAPLIKNKKISLKLNPIPAMANSTEVNYQLKSSERSLYNDSSLMKCQQRLTKLPESAQEQNKYLGKVISSSCIFEEGLNWEDEEDLLLVRPSYTAECNTRHTSGNSRLGTKVKTHATMFFPVKKKVMCNEKGL